MTTTGARIGLLTGPVGVGKTTVAARVLDLAARLGLTCGGLLTPALLDDRGQKVGIWAVDVASGERRLLASTVDCLDGPRVGPYSFDQGTFHWALARLEAALKAGGEPTPAGRPACDLVVVDEIGKLEMWQGTGLAPILPRLAAGEARRTLVVVRDSLLGELQAQLGDVEQVVFRASIENRDDMSPTILRRLLE